MSRPLSIITERQRLIEASPGGSRIEIYHVTDPMPRHKHPFNELVVVLSGQADHMIGESLSTTHAGDVYVFIAEQEHCFENARDLTVVNLQFTNAALSEARAVLNRRPGFRAFFDIEPRSRSLYSFRCRLSLLPDQLRYVRQMAIELETELNAAEPRHAGMSQSIFIHMCGYFAARYHEMTSQRHASINRVGDAVVFMEEHYQDRISVSELASRVNMSESTFMRNFRESMRSSPINYLINYRLEMACKLLRDSTLSVTDSALTVGFNSVEYFSRRFREAYGLSPKEYRVRELADGPSDVGYRR